MIMRKFKDYIVREDEIALKMKKVPGGNPPPMDPAMAYYIRRMSKQLKQSPQLQMREL